MTSNTNTPVAAPEKSQGGCCCGSKSSLEAGGTIEPIVKAAPIEQSVEREKTSGQKSGGCCGGH